MEVFKKTSLARSQPTLGHLPEGRPIVVWFQNEARLGQNNGRMRLGVRTGTRPRLPADQRYQNAYVFGAICPRHGKGAALMLPSANTCAMQMHLTKLVGTAPPGPTPSRSPELNPVENVWQYLRQNWLSNSLFEDYHAIIDAGCTAWNKLIARPETIKSIGLRDWAHPGQ